ncbi:Crp/Fnr family transcriptional regulator [Flammeovirga aprica]|uniref:Crp/Fnr family transcriptional regulator n=1 Tax=Flammeovirga aprica JL-4 TaxID=694437 RepID=A0A7X9XBP9_9BACT|nr:Crp/Fnr family transcriptional regulator [Flammeovirga aprica]NME70976.1 Crp/Fnr family transcriptional regulator [Flammeovirga aprica JL-4]
MIKKIIDSIHPISANSVKEIESLVELVDIQKNETFIQKDRKNNKEYFLLEGICKSYLINPEGEEITISFFTEKSIISPLNTRTKGDISVLNFQALTDVKLATIDAKEFERMMIDHLDIRNFGNTVLRNELSQKVEKEIGLASLTAKERLLKFRDEFPSLENLIPHTDIASYLGITNISLSRIRGDLAR